MIFAFFWLVIGDLITLHQKAIYGFDPFSHHTPFAKTNNTPVKSKNDKGAKFEKSKDQYHFDAVLKNDLNVRAVLNVCESVLINTFQERILLSCRSEIGLRAPPVL